MPKREFIQDRKPSLDKDHHLVANAYVHPGLDKIYCRGCQELSADRLIRGKFHVYRHNSIYQNEYDELVIVCYWCGWEEKIPRNPNRRRSISATTWRHPDIDRLPHPQPVGRPASVEPLDIEAFVWKKGSKRHIPEDRSS